MHRQPAGVRSSPPLVRPHVRFPRPPALPVHRTLQNLTSHVCISFLFSLSISFILLIISFTTKSVTQSNNYNKNQMYNLTSTFHKMFVIETIISSKTRSQYVKETFLDLINTLNGVHFFENFKFYILFIPKH